MSDEEGTSGAKARIDAAGQTSEPVGQEVRAGMLIGLAAFAMSRGISRERILDVTGLGLNELLLPDSRLPDRAYHQLWKHLGEHLPDQALGLQLAAIAPLTDFGALVHAFQHTGTAREAIRLFIRYNAILADRLRLTLIEGPEEAYLRFHHPLDAVDKGYAAEMGIGLGVRLVRSTFAGQEVVCRVEFRHAPHGPREQYTRFFEIPTEFRRPYNAMIFRASLLDARLTPGDKAMLTFLKSHLNETHKRLSARAGSEVARVRTAIAANAERGEYGAEALAKRLGTSLRTLQRQLRSHGLSAGELIEQTREANAKQLLSDRRLSVEEVAFVLGYSSSRAFRRACLRWTGKTPSELR